MFMAYYNFCWRPRFPDDSGKAGSYCQKLLTGGSLESGDGLGLTESVVELGSVNHVG